MNPTEDSLPLAGILARWASGLTTDTIPKRVREFAASQLASQIAAARATLTLPIGQKIIRAFGHPLQNDPKSSAYVLAALTMAIDYDDTMYAGHVSHSTVAVPLAYTQTLNIDGHTLLAAIVSANECAARITAASTLGPFRGQTAAYTHLAGSVAARMYLEQAQPTEWASAWGIAFSAPPWVLDHPFFSSESKTLTASTQIRSGLDACDAALAGMVGAADVFEHPNGFLSKYAEIPLPHIITNGFGNLWHTETFSIKIYPGCAYIDSAIDCAVAIYRRETERGRTMGPDTIDEVVVEASAFTTGMDTKSSPYIDGPLTPVSAIGFSVGYNVAVALTRGSLKTSDLSPGHIKEDSIWRLADRVHVKHDMSLTLNALQATAPIGEALRHAGNAATTWLLEIATHKINSGVSVGKDGDMGAGGDEGRGGGGDVGGDVGEKGGVAIGGDVGGGGGEDVGGGEKGGVAIGGDGSGNVGEGRGGGEDVGGDVGGGGGGGGGVNRDGGTSGSESRGASGDGIVGGSESRDGTWGEPSISFQDATKSIGARVIVRFSDGRTEQEYRKSAIGAIGPEARSNHRELAMRKLTSSGVSDKDAATLLDIESLSSKDLSKLLTKLLSPPV